MPREGGEELVERVARCARRCGTSTLSVLARSPRHVASMLDGLGDDLVENGVRALRRDGDKLVWLAKRHGDEVLEAVARHPGVGVRAVQAFGPEGVTLARRLTTDQMVDVMRHAGELQCLAPAARSSVLRDIVRTPERVAEILARHPAAIGAGGLAAGAVVAAGNLTAPTVKETVAADGTRTREERSVSGRAMEDAGSSSLLSWRGSSSR